LQDVTERTLQKFDKLQGYGDTVLRAEALEEQLVKARKHTAAMQSKLDSAFAQYQRHPRYAGEERRTGAEEQVSPQKE
jgi:hypothetical protein